MALYKVDKLMNKCVVLDVEKLSHRHQTSSLEALHSIILQFVPESASNSLAGFAEKDFFR